MELCCFNLKEKFKSIISIAPLFVSQVATGEQQAE
jgi:hypothetical protein